MYALLPRSFRKNDHSIFLICSCAAYLYSFPELQFVSLLYFQQLPHVSHLLFQLGNIGIVEMTGAVNAAADEVDVCGNPADSGSQLLLLGVIHLDDVPVDEHLPGVCAEIVGAELIHLVANYAQFLLIQADFFADGSCTVWHDKTLLSQYNGHFLLKTW